MVKNLIRVIKFIFGGGLSGGQAFDLDDPWNWGVVYGPMAPKFAVSSKLDQTYGYLSPQGEWTTSHKEAMLFDSRIEAIKFLELELAETVEFITIERITDIDEFRSREDTW